MTATEKWVTVYSNAPSFRRECDDCGKNYHPEASWHRRCNVCRAGATVPPEDVEEQVGYELEEGRDRCMCDPLVFDLRTLGYPTEREDPAFSGTQCNWHHQIVGKRGTFIYVSGEKGGVPVLTCDVAEAVPANYTWKQVSEHSLVKKLGGVMSKDFPPEEIDTYAKIIGVKKR